MQYISLCVWLLMFSIRFSRVIHIVACTSISFLFVTLNNIPLCGYTTLCLPMRQLLGICIVSAFWLLWINAAMSICAWFLYDYMSLIFLDKIPRRGTAGLCVNCMFDFMRSCQTLFPQRLHHFHFFQQCVSVPVSPHPHQCFFFFLTFLVDMS